MDTMLGGLDFTIAYLDDILIKSQDKDEYKMHVNQVFKRRIMVSRSRNQSANFFSKELSTWDI